VTDDDEVRLRALIGETIADATIEGVEAGAWFERLTLTTASGRAVVIETWDTEQYASGVTVELRPQPQAPLEPSQPVTGPPDAPQPPS
jgi:hypothetical protein